MGKPPDLKRISKEDFPSDYQDLIEKLAFPLNSHMEQVRNLFSKNIDIQNLSREFITLTIQTNSSGKPITRPAFKTALSKVKGLKIISGTITSSNTSYIEESPFITFSQNSTLVSIVNISGLMPETTYEFTLEVIS